MLIAGCASAPTGPSLMVLPGKGKTTEQFQTDDAKCRQMATNELSTTKGGSVPDQRRDDMTYMQCMYSQGNQIPALNRRGYRTPYGSAPATSTTVGPSAAPSSTPPPPPAGPPPPPPLSR